MLAEFRKWMRHLSKRVHALRPGDLLGVAIVLPPALLAPEGLQSVTNVGPDKRPKMVSQSFLAGFGAMVGAMASSTASST